MLNMQKNTFKSAS